MDLLADFQTHQIVCLEHQHTYLYAEVIQVVKVRQTCWVRPLILSLSPTKQLSSALGSEQGAIYDLRRGADLLWPIALFRSALDTEVIPLLAQLQDHAASDARAPALATHHQLTQFMRQIWQAHPEAF